MIRGAIFDLDGVLVDSKAAWHETLNALRVIDGLDPVPPRAFEAAWGQSTADDAATFFAGRYTTAELTARYDTEFPRHLSAVRPIEADARVMVDHLHEMGLGLAVATNAPRSTARTMLDAAGLSARFPIVITPDDVPRPKPAPDMIVEACRRLGLPPRETILVGDTIVDVHAGSAAGLTVVGFRTAGAHHRIESLSELPRLVTDLGA